MNCYWRLTNNWLSVLAITVVVNVALVDLPGVRLRSVSIYVWIPPWRGVALEHND